MGTGCPLRRARRRAATTGDGDTFDQDETDADHCLLFGMKSAATSRREHAREENSGKDGDGEPTASSEEEGGGTSGTGHPLCRARRRMETRTQR